MYDIIIIGAGPAGLTAAIYARRAGKTVLVLEKGLFGGQMTFSPKIENYPGFPALSGNELADKMVEQTLSLGAEIEMETVTAIRDEDGAKTVVTEEGEYRAKAVIAAPGAAHRHLGVPGEEELIGSGISFCAVCDGAFFSGQEVAVIGGGNSALQEAILLSEICKKVTVVQNLAFLTGEEKLAEILREKDNVEILYHTVVDRFTGENGQLTGLLLRDTETDNTAALAADGAFVAIGLAPATGFLKELGILDDYGCILADESCVTAVPGLFAAGDCRTKTVRQITTATADGATAALAACKYIS